MLGKKLYKNITRASIANIKHINVNYSIKLTVHII